VDTNLEGQLVLANSHRLKELLQQDFNRMDRLNPTTTFKSEVSFFSFDVKGKRGGYSPGSIQPD